MQMSLPHKLTSPLFCVLFALTILVGCSNPIDVVIKSVKPAELAPRGYPTAGAVSVDITPPPGMAMGGYSLMANKGIGVRTKLKARVIYLNDGKGGAVALVQTDLTAGSLLLKQKVSAKVAKATGLWPQDIVITATHTHSSPVNHFENDFYNKHMSSQSGLDDRYLNFLTNQISQGINTAFMTQKRAKIASGSRVIIGYNRNRSLPAHLENKDLSDEIAKLDIDDKNAVFKAVDPQMHMIRIDGLNPNTDSYLPLAAFSSFSVHATALSPKVEVYNADLFAYAQKDLQWNIQKKHQTPWPIIHAFTTGTQGDMAPALIDIGDNHFSIHPVDWQQTQQLGRALGREAITLFNNLESGLTDSMKIKTIAKTIDLQKDLATAYDTSSTLCQTPAIGTPVVAGAYERRTPFLTAIPFFKGGNILSRSWFNTSGCQGNKSQIASRFIQPMIEPTESFPRLLHLQIVKINDSVILPIPFEVTIQSAKRIVDATVQTLIAESESVNQAWITSNSNGYFGYATTPEEYALQFYEGGHTLYGKNTTPYLTEQLSILATSLHKEQENSVLKDWHYKINVQNQVPLETHSEGERVALITPELINEDESYVRFRWIDVNTSQINLHQPLVQVEMKNKDTHWQSFWYEQQPSTDEGYNIEIRHIANRKNNMAEYEVRWYNPVHGKHFRFNIYPRAQHKMLLSQTFKLAKKTK